MHHMYPVSKGDQLCPLGFHPQVRWPTRCKRCFRDYKEHGGKRGDDVAASSPSLSESTNARLRENNTSFDQPIGRSWTSTSNLSTLNASETSKTPTPKRPSSWTSTPDLDESASQSRVDVVVNLALPRRRHTTMFDTSPVEESVTLKRPPLPPSSKEAPEDLVILRTDSLAERARKMQLKKQNSVERESSREKSIPRTIEKEKSPSADKAKTKLDKKEKDDLAKSKDVQFLIQIKDNHKPKRKVDDMSITTDTTDTTLIDHTQDLDFHEQIETLKRDLEQAKARAERAERDKSDILLRRLASMDTVSNRTAASEALKLQQKVNDLNQQLEDLKDDKKYLSVKVKELEQDLNLRPTKIIEDELKKKLQVAEQLCEELMDENEDMKKELRNMENEIDEMQDNFREDQADEYSTIKKELEQATKNCRILSFKFKKSERKIEQLEQEKQSLASQVNNDLLNKVKKLEDELRISNEATRQLQSEVENTQKAVGKGKTPSLGVIGKSTSADAKYSRASLTRGGSQEDPVQLMRDLQDSLERETDIREQLKFAEEETAHTDSYTQTHFTNMWNLENRGTQTDEADSLTIQIPRSTQTISIETNSVETAIEVEFLENHCQFRECTSLRSVNDIESIDDVSKCLIEVATQTESSLKVTNFQMQPFVQPANQYLLPNLISSKLLAVAGRKLSPTPPSARLSLEAPLDKDEGISDEEDPAELRVLLELNEQESSQLRRKVEELETNNETSKKQIKELQDKLKQSTGKQQQTTSKLPTFLSKTTAADKESDKKLKDLEKIVADLKKQITEKDKALEKLQTTAKTKTKEPLSDAQNVDLKRQLESVELEASVLRTKVLSMEQDNDKLANENKKLALHAARLSRKDSTGDKDKNLEIVKLKDSVTKLEKTKSELENKLRTILEAPVDKLPQRTPKNFSDSSTKMQLQKIIGEQEDEIKEMRAIVLRTGANQVQKLEEENKSATKELKDVKTKIKNLEERISKQDTVIKTSEATKTLLENQIKFDQEKYLKLEKDYDKEKKERARWESKVSDLDGDLLANKKSFEKIKANLEKEIANLKSKSDSGDTVPSKKVQELKKRNDELQVELDREKKHYTELNGKFEHLEEEHLFVKAELTTQKENLQAELVTTKSKMMNFEADLTKITKEKEELNKKLTQSQQKVGDFEGKGVKSSALELENNRLKSNLADKEQEFRNLKLETEMNKDVNDQMKKELDDLRKKLSDFERVNKAQSSLNDHSSNLELEIKKLRQKLETTEISAKSEVAATRLRYEQQVKNLHTELNSLQRQCERFKRDRDTFKQLLEAAQRTIGELKNSSGRISRSSINSGDEDDKSKILALEQQVGCLEDELSEARLESSKIKTELVSEKSIAEIKISELQSKLNEYEEERLINSGRTKIVGMKTKLELSWQKEREDQQRIVQETSTLARDLRQTLFEVERERDKERLESRRKLELLKRANDEELDEGRRKVSELQCDLLELRDAHAKLRTANEKLRRERERYEKERDVTSRRRLEQDGEKKVGALLQTVDELVKFAPDLLPGGNFAAATATTNNNSSSQLNPNKPIRSKSRSPSPGPPAIQISSVLARLAEASEELRKYQRLCEDEKEREKIRRGGMRRAASTENETPEMSRHSIRLSRSSTHNGSLYRKSLSLDQSMQQNDQSIWKQDDGSMSSMQSIDSELGGMVRDSSMDSRLSAGSTQSDMPRGPRKKKRGIMGKLRSLTKGRTAESEGSVQGSDSDVSISSDFKSSKTNLKGRLSGMFKRAGSSSRGNSLERVLDSVERPVSVTTVVTNGQAQLPPAMTPRVRKQTSRPPTPSGSTPSMARKAK
ncbi:centrosomal protein of 290 kDa isoform X1 [Bradysia coprophila]|uniref:centrosomal protein of 290 kDa isoform X1 n=1 Tax=Bradysia coprophila TaxID=38358 RepID=UPI00187DAE8F|nr:centrosomal protein of 290 kDa isoform X1 [Bradysia coprophila]